MNPKLYSTIESRVPVTARSTKIISILLNTRIFFIPLSYQIESVVLFGGESWRVRPNISWAIDLWTVAVVKYINSVTEVVDSKCITLLVLQGDGNIRYYEVLLDPPYIRNLNQYQSSAPQRDLGVYPQIVCITCRDITGRLTMQTSLGLPEDPIIWLRKIQLTAQ